MHVDRQRCRSMAIVVDNGHWRALFRSHCGGNGLYRHKRLRDAWRMFGFGKQIHVRNTYRYKKQVGVSYTRTGTRYAKDNILRAWYFSVPPPPLRMLFFIHPRYMMPGTKLLDDVITTCHALVTADHGIPQRRLLLLWFPIVHIVYGAVGWRYCQSIVSTTQ